MLMFIKEFWNELLADPLGHRICLLLQALQEYSPRTWLYMLPLFLSTCLKRGSSH